jgi:hypothetical protein
VATTQLPSYTLSGTGEFRTTRYSDVCGGTDEFKRLLSEEPQYVPSAEGRQALRDLVDDGLYMLARMEVRLREYQAFRDELERLVQQMRGIEEPRLGDAQAEAERLRRHLDAEAELPAEELIDRAEEIRQVANDMEGALRRHQEAAIAAGRAYLTLKGARGWDDGTTRGTPASVSAGGSSPGERAGVTMAPVLPPGVPEAWLPPSPHREIIVDWLLRGRAALLSEAEAASFPAGPQGREPLVQFEDGGVMPLRVVRWSEEVKNFHPLGSTPHPRGRLYRQRNANPALPETSTP